MAVARLALRSMGFAAGLGADAIDSFRMCGASESSSNPAA
jgi:hypothetical protein